jgi:multiple sugar transport system permease protein
MTISRELDDAAKIDGCNLAGIFFRILLPLSRPALGVVGIFETMYWWNNFFTPLIYLNRPERMTISIGLRLFQTRDEGHLEWTMAMTVLSVIPLIIIFFIAQRRFIQGIVLTGIKG